MVDIVSIANAIHQVQHVADRGNNVCNSDSTVIVILGRRTQHVHFLTLITNLDYQLNRLSVLIIKIENSTLLLYGNAFQHFWGNLNVSLKNNLASFLVNQWLSQNMTLQTTLPA